MSPRSVALLALAAAIPAAAAGCGDESAAPTPSTGRLTVVVAGLPPGAIAAAQVAGPGNYIQPVLHTVTFAELTPGIYVVTADTVRAGGVLYRPAPSTQSVTVAAAASDTATVTYSP